MYSMSTLISRECDKVLHESFGDLSEVEECTHALPYIVRNYQGKDMIQVPGNNYQYLEEMMKLSESSAAMMKLDNSPIILDLLVDSPLINYCKLAKIPHQLVGIDRTVDPPHRPFPVSEFKYLHLDLEDVTNLSNKDKQWLHDYSIRINNHYYYNLLQQSGYPMTGAINQTYRRLQLIKRLGWLPGVKKMIFNTYRSNYTSSLTILTRPEFNSVWRSLSYRDIISDEFDPEHLINIGIQAAHINLVLDDIKNKEQISSRDVYLAKKLIPYSTPSDDNLDEIIRRCCIERAHDGHGYTTLQAIDILITLVRYRKIELNKYVDQHPFIRHLASLIEYID